MKKFLIVLTLILAAGALGVWKGRPAYRQWKQARLLTQARESLRKGDPRSAALSARQALSVNPSSVEACRIIAEITEAMRSPQALDWWQRVVDLSPGPLTNRLALARCGVLQGDYARAAQALQGVAATNQNTSAFHQMAAMVAVGLNNLGAADRHFTEAARLDPGNKLLALNRAVIHLQATNQQVVAGALKSLEQLYADPTYRKDALRHLAMAAMRSQDFARAEVFTNELQADPKAPLDDRLLHLKVLKDGNRPDFGAALTQLEAACAKDAREANALADEAERWLAGLPPEVQAESPVSRARADCCLARKDWKGLQALLQDAKWGEQEFLRLAMLTRANRELQESFAAQAQWRAALKAAAEQPKQLSVLARMSDQWGWQPEREEVLLLITERFPGERWALQSLGQLYLSQGNTRGLHKVYATMLRYDAGDVVAKNNLTTVALQLKLQTSEASELAREAYLKATNNAAFVSTYAYSLHLQDRTHEGLRVLETLKPAQLETPGIALYYGVMLAATNAPAVARKYLDLAATGQLLPEEKALLEVSRKGL